MLIVYTHSLTPRVKYVFKQIFTEILGIDISFSLDKKEFKKINLPKISYSHSSIDNELFFQCHELLFEKGIIERNINVFNYNNLSCFFSVNNSIFPFDPFAASFFMISRYEEYLPHIKDIHGRFEAKESLAFKNNFLEKPIVDIPPQHPASLSLSTYQMFVKSLTASEQLLISEIQFLDDDFVHILKSWKNIYIGASDGSVAEKNGSFGWIISDKSNSSTGIVKCKGRAHGYPMTSFRAEAYGMWSILMLVIKANKFLNLPAENKLLLYCDNKALVNMVNLLANQ